MEFGSLVEDSEMVFRHILRFLQLPRHDQSNKQKYQQWKQNHDYKREQVFP
jgi:hypothetical protein